MEFGMFYEFPVRPGHTEAEAFSEGLDLVDDAEHLGLDATWLSESHVAPGRSVLASPMVIASAIAGRTKKMRVGLAVQVIVCHCVVGRTSCHAAGSPTRTGIAKSCSPAFHRYAIVRA